MVKSLWILIAFLGYSLAFQHEPRAVELGERRLCSFHSNRSPLVGGSLYFMGGVYTIHGDFTLESVCINGYHFCENAMLPQV